MHKTCILLNVFDYVPHVAANTGRHLKNIGEI
jgi:hypothetical protein